MSLVITTSPDITLLDFAILYDLSTGTPSITLTNRSVGNPSGTTNLANCTWWYEITTPNGVYIHEGSELVPDVTTANWTTLTIPAGSWPTPFGTPPYGQVEFSCAVPYVATLYVKDSSGHIFSLPKSVTICRPAGNTDKTLGNFGVADVTATVKCETASVVTNDTTNYTYQNKTGSYAGNTWTFQAPMDENGNIPSPMVVTGEGRVFFPVTYSAEGYQLYMNSLQTYDMGDYQTIKLQYKFKAVFPIWCNVNLCEAYCQLESLQAQLDKSCGDVENPKIKQKLEKVQGLIQEAMMGIMQPLCGINVPAIIEEIKKIGGAKCNCSGMGGINPIANADGDINLSVTTVGAITGTVTNVGNNYTIALEVPGATAGTLQQVTDNGNQTTNPIIVGAPPAAHLKMENTKLQAYKGTNDVLAGLGAAAPGDTEGSLWMRATGTNGTVYLKHKVTGTTYVLIMPAAQGGAGQTLVNDGSGVLSWGSSTGDLQDVTDAGNETTNAIKIINAALKFQRLSTFEMFLYPVAGITANRVQNFLDEDGSIPTLENPHEWSGVQTFQAGKFKIKGVSAGALTFNAPTAISDYSVRVPSTQGAIGTTLWNNGVGDLTWLSPNNILTQHEVNPGNITIARANQCVFVLYTPSGTNTITLPAGTDGDQLHICITRVGGPVGGYTLDTYVLNLAARGTLDSQVTRILAGVSYHMVYSSVLGRWVIVAEANLSNKQTSAISIVANSGAPVLTAGPGAGTSPTVSLTTKSSCIAGVFSVLTGSAPAISDIVATITFPSGFYQSGGDNFLTVSLTPGNANAAALTGTSAVFVDTVNVSAFNVNVGAGGLAAATTYKWHYQVIAHE